MNCDPLELEVPDSYKKTYCDWASSVSSDYIFEYCST